MRAHAHASRAGAADVAWLVLKAPVELLSGVASGALLGRLVTAPGTHTLGPSTHAAGALLCALLVVFGGKVRHYTKQCTMQ